MNHIAAWDAEHGKRLMFAQPLRAVQGFFAQFNDPRGVRVLEVGCGAGSNAVWLADRGFQVFAYDSSPNAITRLLDMDTERRIRGAAVGDACKLPFPDNHFDIVFEVRALENLSATEAMRAYKEIARVLAHGGAFFGVTASMARDLTRTTCGVVRRSTMGEVELYMQNAGLATVEIAQRFEDVHDLAVVAWKVEELCIG